MTYDPDTGIVTDRTDPEWVVHELVERATERALQGRGSEDMRRLAMLLRDAAHTLEVRVDYHGRAFWASLGEPHPDGGRVLDLMAEVEVVDEVTP